MPDKKSDAYTVISITEETPLEFWCTLLNCEKSNLLYAMSCIGNSYSAVDYFLDLNRLKTIPDPLNPN